MIESGREHNGETGVRFQVKQAGVSLVLRKPLLVQTLFFHPVFGSQFFLFSREKHGLHIVSFGFPIEEKTGDKEHSENKEQQPSQKRKPSERLSCEGLENDILHQGPAVDSRYTRDTQQD